MILRLRAFLAAFACLVSGLAAAQADFRPFGKEQIDQLTAQIALFPDALLSQVLMAATYPKDVAEASTWARANPDEKGDAAVSLVQDKPWDPSVQSLVAFPQVVVMMGENPTWVKDLGDAFLLQPEDVMDSVQRLRLAAQNAGNLQSNEQVVVKVETQPPPDIVVQVNAPPPPPQVIVIEQRSPEVIFVPMYNPVNVFGPWMWPAFPPVWIPPPPGFWWSWRSPVAVGIWWGVGIGVTHAAWGRANWWGRSVNINVHHHNSIHINNRIDRRDRNTTWAHDTNRRRDIPFRGGDETRQRLDDRAARVDREQFRGREADRARAEQALRDRGVTTDRAALRDVNRDDLRRPVQDTAAARVATACRASIATRHAIARNRWTARPRSTARRERSGAARDRARRSTAGPPRTARRLRGRRAIARSRSIVPRRPTARGTSTAQPRAIVFSGRRSAVPDRFARHAARPRAAGCRRSQCAPADRSRQREPRIRAAPDAGAPASAGPASGAAAARGEHRREPAAAAAGAGCRCQPFAAAAAGRRAAVPVRSAGHDPARPSRASRRSPSSSRSRRARSRSRAYPTPMAAAEALVDGIARHDDDAVRAALGTDYGSDVGREPRPDDVTTFLEAWARSRRIVPSGDAKARLEVGRYGWTLPIPIVKGASGWSFDTAATPDELRARRIGRNELAAMQAMLAYVDAQDDYQRPRAQADRRARLRAGWSASPASATDSTGRRSPANRKARSARCSRSRRATATTATGSGS